MLGITVNQLAEKLTKTSLDLLDLSARNRLISTSRSTTRSTRLDIVDELSSEVFRILVLEKRKMSFLPSNDEDEESGDDFSDDSGSTIELGQPEEDEPEEHESSKGHIAERHLDLSLQTRLKSDKLQNRLLKLFRDARTCEEEQGVNTLYLALGFLKWREADSSSKDRFAPLILVPVTLARRSANTKFHLEWTEDDLSTNLSLQAKLNAEFGIQLPDLPEIDDLNPTEYFADVRRAIAAKPDWTVIPDDMTLWFFSFSKFLMYRDLQASNWPEERSLEENPMVCSLLEQGFVADPPLCQDDDNVDKVIDVRDMIHVMDADSSQAIAVEEAVRGRSMVIQGPPGTGKSQTITNLIASFVNKGKKVLFVAEKMAALEVVKRRLATVGLGDACLELHSHKANKKLVLQDLGRTLDLGRPKVGDVQEHLTDLGDHRDRLNRYANLLHTRLSPSGLTPYQILGSLIRLRANDVKPGHFGPLDVSNWTLIEFKDRLATVKELSRQR